MKDVLIKVYILVLAKGLKLKTEIFCMKIINRETTGQHSVDTFICLS